MTWSFQLLKMAGLCATFALLGISPLAQAQQEPKAPVAAEAPKPGTAVMPKPSAEELARWRKTIVHTTRPEKACFVADYPATAWTKIPCGKPPNVKFQLAGGTGDESATVSGHISQAEGSFDAVIGVHSACSASCQNGCPANYTCSSGNLKNNFSLQLNTNLFTSTKACNGCVVWEQFIFTNHGCPQVSWTTDLLIDVFAPSPACAFIQYWLLFQANGTTPYSPCQDGWRNGNPGCYVNSQNAVLYTPFSVDDLALMKLSGAVAGVYSKDDWVTFIYGGRATSAPGDNRLPELSQSWNQVEFNVLGNGGGSEVVFNPESMLVVRIQADNGARNAPMCKGTRSGESNNLLPIAFPTFFPTASSPYPALVFVETNDPAAKPVYLCQGVVTMPGTN
jgi:hypothetical protein